MDSENVIQILGVIVQSYASILAIGAGFFTFLVQRFRDELRFAEEKIERNVDIIAEAFAHYGLHRELIDFKVGAIEQGPDWVKDELNKIYRRGDALYRIQLSKGQLQAIENLKVQYPRYKGLKQKGERTPYILFSGFLLFCSLVIILSLISIGLIDIIVESQISNQIVWFIEGIASVGVIYVAFFGWRIATIFR